MSRRAELYEVVRLTRVEHGCGLSDEVGVKRGEEVIRQMRAEESQGTNIFPSLQFGRLNKRWSHFRFREHTQT